MFLLCKDLKINEFLYSITYVFTKVPNFSALMKITVVHLPTLTSMKKNLHEGAIFSWLL